MDNYILYMLSFFLVLFAQAKVTNAYHKYKNMYNYKNLSGMEIARKILDANGLQDIAIEVSNAGMLSDHYDPVHKVVRLSSDIYYHNSIASAAVAAHEVGHALQHKEHYGLIALRNRLLPAVNIASNLGWIVLLLGIFFLNTIPYLLYIGIAMLLIIVLFQLVTLPLELNASKRAIVQLQRLQCIDEREVKDCRSMLHAAAFTYLAALLSSMIQVLRVILITRRSRD